LYTSNPATSPIAEALGSRFLSSQQLRANERSAAPATFATNIDSGAPGESIATQVIEQQQPTPIIAALIAEALTSLLLVVSTYARRLGN